MSYRNPNNKRITILVRLTPEEGQAIKMQLLKSKQTLTQAANSIGYHGRSGVSMFSRILTGKGSSMYFDRLEKLYEILKKPSELGFVEGYALKSGSTGITEVTEKEDSPELRLYNSIKYKLDQYYVKSPPSKQLEILSKLESILQIS